MGLSLKTAPDSLPSLSCVLAHKLAEGNSLLPSGAFCSLVLGQLGDGRAALIASAPRRAPKSALGRNEGLLGLTSQGKHGVLMGPAHPGHWVLIKCCSSHYGERSPRVPSPRPRTSGFINHSLALLTPSPLHLTGSFTSMGLATSPRGLHRAWGRGCH